MPLYVRRPASENGLSLDNSRSSSNVVHRESRRYGGIWQVTKKRFIVGTGVLVAVAVVSSQWRGAEMTFISPPPPHQATREVLMAIYSLPVKISGGEVVTAMSRQLGPHPRAVFLDGSPWTTRPVDNNMTTTAQVVLYPLMTGSTDISSGNAEQDTSRRIFDPNCEYMYDWQTTFHPTCNEFHATNLADVLVDNRAELLGNGGWRQGWKMTYPRMNTAASTNAIWKTSLFRRMYAVAMIAREKSRVDAVAMERLQGSPRVIDIYSYCAMSVATEFVGGGNNTMDEATRDMSPREKLSVAIEIAQSIAEVHSMARLAHNDLHAGNLLFTTSGKRLKVNDFNQGVLFTKHNKTGEICLSAGSSSTRILRGPEEQEQDRADRDARGDKANNGVKTDKVDIYFLGNALFRLAVGRKPWKHGNAKYKRWAAEQKRHGSLPRVPSDVHNSPDPAVQTLLKAVQACYRYDPKARPTAAQVVAFLQNQTSTL